MVRIRYDSSIRWYLDETEEMMWKPWKSSVETEYGKSAENDTVFDQKVDMFLRGRNWHFNNNIPLT
jgi:hypothetical protein